MTEHPTIRCPICGLGAIDVAPEFDPFARQEDGSLGLGAESIHIQAHCPSGHEFLQSETRAGERESVAVGTPEWDERAKRMA